MSFGGWLALNYAVAAPERVQKLVLLSPGGFLPMVRQFSLRGMLMVFVPDTLHGELVHAVAGIHWRAGCASLVLESDVPRSEAFSSSARDGACHAHRVL